MPNKLDQLKKFTTVVCDTGDVNAIKQYGPEDATTNPTLIFRAATDPAYQHLVDDAIRWGMRKTANEQYRLNHIMDKLFVNFGLEILKIVPGRISTEVSPHLAFDVHATIQKAMYLVGLYEAEGIDRARVLIKIPSTWEGMLAAKVLEKSGFQCNMTLLFSLVQAVAAAEIGATMISPYVGRILDWHKAREPNKTYSSSEDPGVISVHQIYNYYKHIGYHTQIMGASFRNTGEVLELAGCDFLTVDPKILGAIQKETGTVTRILSPEKAKGVSMEPLVVDEAKFRYLLNDNAMATEQLSDGIRHFALDFEKLEKYVLQRVGKIK